LLEKFWPDISRVQFAEFAPDHPADYFSWHAAKGVNQSDLPNATHSYTELQSQFCSTAGSELPYPEVALSLLPFWLMVCPHRASPFLVTIVN
jgi:hypothetical protein